MWVGALCCSVYLSLWRHLLMGGKLLQPRGKCCVRLQLLGGHFERKFLILIRVLQAILREVGHLQRQREMSYRHWKGDMETHLSYVSRHAYFKHPGAGLGAVLKEAGALFA